MDWTDHEFIDDVNVIEFGERFRFHNVENLNNIRMLEMTQQFHFTQGTLRLHQIGES